MKKTDFVCKSHIGTEIPNEQIVCFHNEKYKKMPLLVPCDPCKKFSLLTGKFYR